MSPVVEQASSIGKAGATFTPSQGRQVLSTGVDVHANLVHRLRRQTQAGLLGGEDETGIGQGIAGYQLVELGLAAGL
ncbi:hypothetical protein [Halomonas aquatica]|uniref:Uncharacterized protein n=1 Tax=Halomonas aquatica TaxID=3151123 RepID=A0ABV1NGL1_9GAMM